MEFDRRVMFTPPWREVALLTARLLATEVDEVEEEATGMASGNASWKILIIAAR